MLPATPPPEPPVPPRYTECIVAASAYYNVPSALITAVLVVEGGRVGHVSPNTNGTVDMGPMQINSIHLPKFKAMGVPREAIVNSACVNIAAGTYILDNRLAEQSRLSWDGAANYHSKTPKYHNRYLELLQETYVRILAQHAAYVRYLHHAVLRRTRLLKRLRRTVFRPRPTHAK